MRRSRLRLVIHATLAVAMGWSGDLFGQEVESPAAPTFSAIAPAPPKIDEKPAAKPEPAGRDDRDQADEPDSEQIDGRTVETIRERNAQGQVRVLRQVGQDSDGNYFNHGIWKRWDADGHLIAIGDYREGQRHGHWEQVIFSEYVALLKQAPYREFSGPFLSEASFERGKLHGKWTISDADGRKVSEIELASGVRHGTATWFYPNGQRFQEIHYVDGLLEGDLIRWDSRGAEVSRKSFKQGREVVVKSQKYDNGRLRSQVTMLSPALTIETLDNWAMTEFSKYTVNGEQVKQGPLVLFHPNGQKAMEGSYEANEPIGKHLWWHVNGQKSIEGSYRGGKADGTWTWWHPEGPKSTQGDYSEGSPVGEWIWWNLEGKVVQRASLGTANSPTNVAQPGPQTSPQLARPEATSKLITPEPPAGPGSSRRR